MNSEFDEFVETNEFFNTVDLVCKRTDFKPLSDTPIQPLNTGIDENEYTDRNDNKNIAETYKRAHDYVFRRPLVEFNLRIIASFHNRLIELILVTILFFQYWMNH